MKKFNSIFYLLILFLIMANKNQKGENMDKKNLKTKLTPMQYNVTQECGTEPAFNNEYWNNKKPGIYVDVVSGEPLFTSLDKFDSGTGWPSFNKPLHKENIVNNIDKTHGMIRTEVKSKKGNSHLGHLFDDGPAPTGQRYCINSAALRFIPLENLEKEGYGEYKKLFNDQGKTKDTEKAILAAGCFWGVQAIFDKIPGVLETKVGYTGGNRKNPNYSQVSTGSTGHAEAVEVKFDPRVISYKELLNYFWRLHDPTTLNRQGPDMGTQYRSMIFYHNDNQKKIAEESKKEFDKSGVFKDKSVTEIVPAKEFYPAEDYHQKYFKKNNGHGCHILREK